MKRANEDDLPPTTAEMLKRLRNMNVADVREESDIRRKARRDASRAGPVESDDDDWFEETEFEDDRLGGDAVADFIQKRRDDFNLIVVNNEIAEAKKSAVRGILFLCMMPVLVLGTGLTVVLGLLKVFGVI